MPRVKKVTYTPEWKDGKPQRQATAEEAERSPRIVKYLRLESYEDALDSIEFDQPTDQLHLPEPSEEYLLRYMLSWETKDSDTLLNPARLASPFSYRLGVHVNGEKQERWVDLAETFNYLLGLKVQTRKALDDNGRRYLLFRGETRAAPGRRSQSSGGRPKAGLKPTLPGTGTSLNSTTWVATPIRCTSTETRPSPAPSRLSQCSRRGCSPA